MYLNEFKDLLNKTKKELPPHYPTKTHDIQDSVNNLIINLRNITDYIGLSNANIAIKNIFSKSISSFLITSVELNTNFILKEVKLENGKKITITSESDIPMIEITYLNNGTIKLENKQKLNIITKGENYSNTTLIYNVNNPNELTIQGTFPNRLQYNYNCLFSDDGIEQKRNFKFTSSVSSIIGTYERDNDFFSGKLNIELTGNFPQFNEQQIKAINSQKELTTPILSNHDLNLLTLATEHDKSMRFSNGITFQIENYINYQNIAEFFEEDYEKLKNTVYHNPYSLEINSEFITLLPIIIHGAYSDEILQNIKKIVKTKIRTK